MYVLLLRNIVFAAQFIIINKLVTFFSPQNGNLNVVGLDLRIYVLGINLSIPSWTFRRAYLVRDI